MEIQAGIEYLIEIIKKALEKDTAIKMCCKYHSGKALQIKLLNGTNFNLRIVKLNDKTYVIKRTRY